MSEEKQFVDGLFAKNPGDNPATAFVKAKLSFKLDDFKKWVGDCVKAEPDMEWLNVEIKESKSGHWYAERVTWKPAAEAAAPAPKEDIPW